MTANGGRTSAGKLKSIKIAAPSRSSVGVGVRVRGRKDLSGLGIEFAVISCDRGSVSPSC